MDIGLCYNSSTNRAKCASKKKSAKIFSTKDSSHLYFNGEAPITLRTGEDRRSASSIGFYMADRNQNSQSSYNRYVKNQYASTIANSKAGVKAKSNNSMIQRQLKSRGVKNMYSSNN